MISSKPCLCSIVSVLSILILTGCAPGRAIQSEKPALQRGVAEGVIVEQGNQFNTLLQYGIFIADSREGTHLILPSDKLFVETVPDVVIQPDFYVVLNHIVDLLNAYPNVTIAVVGHTNSTMSAAMQANVSLREARRLADYLTTAGVSAGRIVRVEGVGDRQPMVEGNGYAARQLNRRVEVIVNAPLA